MLCLHVVCINLKGNGSVGYGGGSQGSLGETTTSHCFLLGWHSNLELVDEAGSIMKGLNNCFPGLVPPVGTAVDSRPSWES